MKNEDQSIEFSFTKPLYFVLYDVIAIPEINENLHLKFIEDLYLKFKLGHKTVDEAHEQISCQYTFNVYEILYIGEKYGHYDIFFKVKNLVDDINNSFRIVS
ncbi:Uncharacterized protein CTYZ_00002191 [Cryptosporidium tyzzeri]|nr:Uncharacterized protein CTYZ_00002192 [Cryptosporidium tyzzeri]TRY52098.1 Uncharacterized protein CTYZ_00002191 [Cryptosporidium tyzzeri]